MAVMLPPSMEISPQLESCGLPIAAQIHDVALCTYQQYDTYFSARRLGIQSGRIFTGIMMK